MYPNAPALPADQESDRALALSYAEDCARHYWIGVFQGAGIVALAWATWALS